MRKATQIVLIAAILLCLHSCFIFQPSLEKMTQRALEAHAQYDAIIVPGVPFREPNWDTTMQARIRWSHHLYQQGKTKKIIMSGGSVYSPYVEAQIMKLYAIELGVPEGNILIEDKAEHSTENIWYSYKLAKKTDLTTLLLLRTLFKLE